MNLWGFFFSLPGHFVWSLWQNKCLKKREKKTSTFLYSERIERSFTVLLRNIYIFLQHKRWCLLNICTNIIFLLYLSVLGLKWCTLCVKSYWYKFTQLYQFHFYIWTVLISKCDSFFNIFQQTKKDPGVTQFLTAQLNLLYNVYSNMIIKFSYQHYKSIISYKSNLRDLAKKLEAPISTVSCTWWIGFMEPVPITEYVKFWSPRTKTIGLSFVQIWVCI